MGIKEIQMELLEVSKKHPLYQNITKTNGKIVFGRGNVNSPEYLFLTDTPKWVENRLGQPLMGDDKKILDVWLNEYNITDYVIINAIPIIPLDGTGNIRKPTREELDYFRPYIMRLIEEIAPKYIICLGKTALECLQKDIKACEWLGNIGFQYHPSYFMRQGKDGLQQFKMLINAKDKTEYKCDKILVNTPELFKEFLNTINKDMFAFDTETTDINIQKLKLCGISFYDGSGTAWYLPFGHSTKEQQLDLENCEYECELSELFNNANLIIGHNLVFDMQVLKKYNIYPENVKWFDTMVAQHLVDEESEKGLKFLAKYYFGHTMKTYNEVSKNENFANVRIEDAKEYSCDDSIQTFRLYELLSKKIEELDLHKLFYDIEMPFLRCIIDMEQNGILVDNGRIETLKVELKHKLREIESEIAKHLPSKYKSKGLFESENININLGSSKQLSQLLFSDLKLTVKEKSDKTGNASVGIPALKQIVNEHPIIKPLLKYKEYQKLSSAFLEALPKHIEDDGRVHCRFNDVGTVSGRCSSNSPNLQQLPRNDEISIRSCFIAPKGKKFIVFDYAQEELRLTAFLSQDEDMIRAFENGMDSHLVAANKIYHLNLSDAELKDGTPEHKLAKEKFGKLRQNAKSIVSFGILYGMSEFHLSEILGISTGDAKQIIDDYFKASPRIKQLIDNTHNQVRSKGFVRNFYGRYRHFHKENGQYKGNTFRQSFNTIIQGFAADFLRASMINILKFIRQNNNEAKLIFTVHDELCVEVPEDKVEFYEKGIKEIMENNLVIRPKLIASSGVGNNYAEAK